MKLIIINNECNILRNYNINTGLTKKKPVNSIIDYICPNLFIII